MTSDRVRSVYRVENTVLPLKFATWFFNHILGFQDVFFSRILFYILEQGYLVDFLS